MKVINYIIFKVFRVLSHALYISVHKISPLKYLLTTFNFLSNFCITLLNHIDAGEIEFYTGEIFELNPQNYEYNHIFKILYNNPTKYNAIFFIQKQKKHNNSSYERKYQLTWSMAHCSHIWNTDLLLWKEQLHSSINFCTNTYANVFFYFSQFPGCVF